MSQPFEKYDWSNYRKRRFHFIFGLIATVGVMTCMGWVEDQAKWLGPVVWILWCLIIVVPLAFRFGFSTCPRCGKAVHFIKGFGYPFSPKCLNCGIKVGSSTD